MIYIATEHTGYYIKNTIIEKCQELNLQISDLVPNLSQKDDYPKIAKILSETLKTKFSKIKKSEIYDPKIHGFGIAICGSGQGIAMALNRNSEIRACVAQNAETVVLARQHNQANVLCFGANVVLDIDIIMQMILTMQNTQPDLSQRHLRRVDQLSKNQ